MTPGAYELTVILCSASSSADKCHRQVIHAPLRFVFFKRRRNTPALCVNPRTANFDAQYTERVANPRAQRQEHQQLGRQEEYHSFSAHPSSLPWTPHLKVFSESKQIIRRGRIGTANAPTIRPPRPCLIICRAACL